MEHIITHNQAESRFEMHIGHHVAHVDYTLSGNVMNITHTKVPKDLEGQGIAGQLTLHILNYAIDKQYKVNPVCPYTKVYIDKHLEFQSLLV